MGWDEYFFAEPKGPLWGFVSLSVGLLLIGVELYYLEELGMITAVGTICIGFGIADFLPQDNQRPVVIVRAVTWGISSCLIISQVLYPVVG